MEWNLNLPFWSWIMIISVLCYSSTWIKTLTDDILSELQTGIFINNLATLWLRLMAVVFCRIRWSRTNKKKLNWKKIQIESSLLMHTSHYSPKGTEGIEHCIMWPNPFGKCLNCCDVSIIIQNHYKNFYNHLSKKTWYLVKLERHKKRDWSYCDPNACRF